MQMTTNLICSSLEVICILNCLGSSILSFHEGNISGINPFVQTVKTSIQITRSTSKRHEGLDNFTINHPLLITLFSLPLRTPLDVDLVPILKFAWFARKSWFVIDMFPFAKCLFGAASVKPFQKLC